MRRPVRMLVLATLAGSAVWLAGSGSGWTQTELLSYRIAATYVAPDGQEVVTDQTALLLVPSLVDVDHDLATGLGGADVLVQLTIDAGRATLRVQTLPNAPSPLPLRLEAIVADPRGTSDLRVAYGFDATEARAPQVYSSTIHLLGDRRVTSFGLDVETVAPGPSIDVIAEVYQEGPGGTRLDPQRGRVRFTPVPLATHFGILLGRDLGTQQSGLDMTTDTPTKVEVLIEDLEGSSHQISTAVIDRLPHIMSLVLTESDDGRKTWNYQATEVIGRIDLDIRELRAGAIVDDFALHLRDVALTIVLVQDTPTHATLQADRPIGAIEAGSANGRAVEFLEEPAYLYSTDDGNGDSFAFRILGLSRAEFDSGDPFIVDVSIKPGPFHVLIEEAAGAWIDANIRDLPDRIRLELSGSAGTVEWTGSDRIGELDVRAHDPDGFLGGSAPGGYAGEATELRLTLRDVPERLSLGWGSAGGATVLDAHGASIGTVLLDVTSGPDIDVDEGFDGVVLHDLPDHYALAIRLTGLRRISVSTGEPPYRLELRKAPGPFLAHLLQGARDTRIEVRDLPDSLDVTLDPDGTLSYEASAPIAAIDAEITDPAGVSGRATRLALGLDDVPASLSLGFSAGAGAELDAHGAELGEVSLLLTSGPEMTVEDGFDGIEVEDLASHYALAARLRGLRYVSVTGDELPYRATIRKRAGPFLVRLDEAERTARIEVHDLPDSMEVTFDPTGTLAYEASARIGRVAAEVRDPAGLADRATRLSLAIEDLPASLTLGFAPEEGRTVIDAHGDRVGSLDVLLTSGPEIEVPHGADGIVLDDVASHYAVVARLRGLSLASITASGGPYELSLHKDAGPFVIRLNQGARVTAIDVNDMPSRLDATFDPDGVFAYEASSGIGSVLATIHDPAGVAGRANTLRLVLAALPDALTIRFSAADEILLDASGSGVGLIDVLATSGPVLAVDDGFDGAILEDLPSHYVFAARMTGLRLARVSTGTAPYTLSLRKTPGPFMVRLVEGDARTNIVVRDLPSSVDATLDPAGTLTYAASSVVGRLDADISDPAGVAGRATRARVSFGSLPTSLNVSWNATSGTVNVDARGATLGSLEALLTSGPDLSLPADRDGFVLHDLDDYTAFVRVTGLRKAVVAQGPPPSLTLDTAGGRRFVIDLRTRKPSGVATTSADIQVLPASLSLRFTGPSALAYTASGPVGEITLNAFDPDGISGRAKTLRGTLRSLPSALDASWTDTGRVTFDAKGGTVGLVEVQLTSGPDDRLDPSVDGLLLNDLADRYVVFARVTGLRKIVGIQSPSPDLTLETTGGRTFVVDINDWNGSKVEYTRARLEPLPTSVRLRVVSGGGDEVFYTASGTATSLVFDSNGGNRWNLHAEVRDPVPASFSMCSSGNGYCSGFARSAGAGAFKFSASQHTTVDVFDCKRPLNASCVRGSASEFTDLRDWRVRYVNFDADFDDLGFSGYTWIDTDGHAMKGYLLDLSSGGGLEANFPNGFWAENRRVKWDFWGLFKDKSGSISCPGGTSLSVRVLGFWLGVTSYMC